MNIEQADNSRAVPSDTGALTSQSLRRQWEQQWLQANRDAQRVVQHRAGDAPNEISRRGAVATDVDQEQANADARPNAHNPVQSRSAVQSAPFKTVMGAGAVASRSTEFYANLASQVPVQQQPSSSATASDPVEVRAAAPVARDEVRRLAIWLDNERARASLSLPEHVASEPVIGQLRKWLRAAGLTLVNVVINGVVRWRGGERPPGDGY